MDFSIGAGVSGCFFSLMNGNDGTEASGEEKHFDSKKNNKFVCGFFFSGKSGLYFPGKSGLIFRENLGWMNSSIEQTSTVAIKFLGF